MGTPKGTVFGIGHSRSQGGHWTDATWGFIGGILPAAAALLARMRAIDLAYHVRAGELTLRTGHVLRNDLFTFTRGGHRWLNQQWGAQVVFAWVHRILGWVGVALTYAVAVGAGFALVYRSCLRAGSGRRSAAVLTLVGFVLGASASGARPQALAIPLFASTWLLLARRDRWTWLVPVLVTIWANVHGSFVLAPLLAAFATADDLVERRPVGRSALVSLATIGATLVTPFGAAVWSYAFDVVRDPTIRNTVAEWRPPTLFAASGAVFYASGAAVVALAASRRARVRAVDVARLVVFFALGAAALRSTLWWALAAPPIVAGWLATDGRARDRDQEGRTTRERSAAPPAVAFAVSLALIPLGLIVRSGVDPVTGGPARLAADAPEVLVGATRRALPAGSHLLVYQPFASWFEYSLPDYPVMVDSRIEVYPERVWDDYDTAIVAADGWETVTQRYAIAGIVLPPRAVLARDLAASADWRRVIDGPAGSVFVRR